MLLARGLSNVETDMRSAPLVKGRSELVSQMACEVEVGTEEGPWQEYDAMLLTVAVEGEAVAAWYVDGLYLHNSDLEAVDYVFVHHNFQYDYLVHGPALHLVLFRGCRKVESSAADVRNPGEDAGST